MISSDQARNARAMHIILLLAFLMAGCKPPPLQQVSAVASAVPPAADSAAAHPAPKEGGSAIVIGARQTFHSTILREDRTILVHKPASYEKGKVVYPVLYLLDGEEHFHHTTELLNNFAFRVYEKHHDEAMAAFKLSVALHPDSATAYDTLGQAYGDGGQLDLARECFEIAVRKGTETSDPYLPEMKAHLDRVSKPKAK